MAWTNVRKLQEIVREALLSSKYLVVFDTETTGLSKNDRIIELAAQKVEIKRDENGDIVFGEPEKFHEFINPYPLIISPEITAINHIRNEDVADKDTEEKVIPRFRRFCGEEFAFVAHNSSFDTTKIQEACGRIGLQWEFCSIDTLALSRGLLELENNKLITIAEHYDIIPDDANFHSAFFDVEMTTLIAERLLNELRHTKVQNGARRPQIFSISEFSKGHTQRTYVQTSIGSIWYDRKTHQWGAGTKSAPLDIDGIDMEYVERTCDAILSKNEVKSIAHVHKTIYA